MSDSKSDFTPEEIAQFKAYEAYLAKQANQQVREETSTGMLPAIGGIGGAVVGASMGAKQEIPKALKNAVKGVGKTFASGAAEAAPSTLTSGDKWAKAIGGPGGIDQDAAVQNRAIQKGLTPKEAAEFKVAREGIIVPKKIEEEAAKKAASKAKSISTKAMGLISSPVGKVVNKAVGLGGAGYELGDAIDRGNKGEYGRAAISGLGALGSAASLLPHPVAKLGGAAIGIGAPMLNHVLDKFAKENPELYKKMHLAMGGLVGIK